MKKIMMMSLALALAGCGERAAETTNTAANGECRPPEMGGVDRCNAGKAMPEVTLVDGDEAQMTLAELAGGEPILVNLWASWCAPCVKELPTLLALSQREGAPRVLAVNQGEGPAASVRAFLESHGVEALGVWRDPDMTLTDALPVTIMPTTILYDGEGKEVWRYVGDLEWDGAEAAELLGELP
ncbi:TlpA family protein disulfide reductase [Sphingomicrobium flavum]|uniref:TlpA family protein disulfide reductase n=1 Tax=Sphingomicrobium flavum TaxID=1229164 RepID=UPI0021ADBD3E|nr:TlpA family protein disulfide reductase [Sphingomicrobium flavum]